MTGRLPPWFKQKLPDPQAMRAMTGLIERSNLHTVCESAQCPNSGECFSRHTATFLILGNVCTRHCTFCAVTKGTPVLPDPDEPQRLLNAAHTLGLSYAVVTSVTRDDLSDGGASQFARVIEALHTGGIDAEVLVPDFGGSEASVHTVAMAGPQVINHNIETVPRLYREVRPGADYSRSLGLLSSVKKIAPQVITKSGMMLGLGEAGHEVLEVMKHLREAGCDLLTIGQYLQPSPAHRPVAGFVTPDEFAQYEAAGRELGFAAVASAPLVRSSFHAATMYATVKPGRDKRGV